MRGLPIPAPDEIPLPESNSPTLNQAQWAGPNYKRSVSATILTPSQPRSITQDASGGTHAYNQPESNNSAPTGGETKSSLLFRGRSKTLASISSKLDPQPDMRSHETALPKDPYVNGHLLEASLYKDVLECPICFLYYPPYLNKTRCCDQPICSECFVQIKRPDPHPPEHTDPNSPPPLTDLKPYEEEGQLVSEPAMCPFCVQNEFGVTYDPPPFRRGLTYANQTREICFVNAASAMSSTSSLSPSDASPSSFPGLRRRTQSVSANAPTVITTDRIRPDWATKLSDARGNAARRSAAATALHIAAYAMGPIGGTDNRFTGLGRRRRTLLGADSGGSSGNNTPRLLDGLSASGMEALLTALEAQGSSRNIERGHHNLFPGRFSSRASRTKDLEEIMMMEAIRQSLAAEEDRKKREDKEIAKTAKKEEKAKAKEQKKAEKAAKKSGLYQQGTNSSIASFYGAGRSSSVTNDSPVEEGKGKARATNYNAPVQSSAVAGFNPPIESITTSALNTLPTDDAQQHLEQSRAVLDHDFPQKSSGNVEASSAPRFNLRQMSGTSSSGSSFVDSVPGSFRNAFCGSESSFNASPNTSGHHLPFSNAAQEAPSGSGAGTESVFNFGSLAAMIDREAIVSEQPEHSHDARSTVQSRSRGGSGESSTSAPPRYEEQDDNMQGVGVRGVLNSNAMTAASRVQSNAYDQKHYGDVRMLEQSGAQQLAN